MALELEVQELVGGAASGELLHADVGLSFWGGCDPLNGVVIDHTHPLHTKSVAGKMLAIPNGRGSCTGSQVMLELILNGAPDLSCGRCRRRLGAPRTQPSSPQLARWPGAGEAPKAILLRQPDVIVSLGVVVAEEVGTCTSLRVSPPPPFVSISLARRRLTRNTRVFPSSSARASRLSRSARTDSRRWQRLRTPQSAARKWWPAAAWRRSKLRSRGKASRARTSCSPKQGWPSPPMSRL